MAGSGNVLWLRGQQLVLEKVAAGAPLSEVLEALLVLIEQASAVTFHALIQTSPFGIYVVDADFRVAEASHTAREAFGMERLVGTDLADALRTIWPEPFAAEAIARFRHTLSTGEPYIAKDTVERRADREAVEAYDWRIERIVMPDGRHGVVCYFYDLSERQRIESELRASETRLRESEERYRLTIDSATDYAIITLDMDGTIVGWNAGAERMMGYTEAEAVGQAGAIFFTPEDRDAGVHAEEMQRARDEGRAGNERWHVRKDGSRFWGSGLMMPLRDGQRRGYVKIFQDRTAAHHAGRQLEAAAAALRHAQSVARLGSWVWDAATDATTGSEELYRIYGLDPSRAFPDFRDQRGTLYPVESWEKINAAVLRALETATGYVLDVRAFRGAEPIWVTTRCEVERDGRGCVVRLHGTVQDITERKSAETALREHEERLRLATEHADVGFWDVDLINDTLTWPPLVKAMFGISADAPVSMADDFYPRLHPADRAATSAAFAAACDPRKRALYDVEYRTVGKEDGVIRWVAAKGRGVFDAAGRCVRVTGVATEITARKRAEAALASSEAELRRLNEGLERRVAEIGAERDSAWRLARDMFVVLDPGGVFLSMNPAVREILGWTQEAMIGRSCLDFIHPDDAASSEAALTRAGPPFENRYRHKDGGWRTISWVAAPERGRIFAYGRDVTAERDAARQLEEAQRQLAHIRRMEALGQLAGGVAHDFNNVLQAVQGGASLIERRPADPEGVRRLARMVIEAAARGSAVTRRLLAFSRRGDLRAEMVDPVSLLTGLREILTHTLGAGVGVRVAATAGMPSLLADKGQLETVLINLATNARDAMAGNGALTLGASVEVLPKASTPRPAAELKPGSYVRLFVTDTGIGMTPEILARVAEPFFTTKPQGQGTGLGLAMARGFIEQSGGAMLIESKAGSGTTVHVWLPVGTAGVIGAHGDTTERPRKAARLLVVDDEPIVREIITEQLEAAGHCVVSAGTAQEALAILNTGELFDLLISDLSMPGMDGMALVRESHRRRPRLPAILLTGFATNAVEIAMTGAVSGKFSLLRKPVTEQELLARVAMLLEGPRLARA